jgi:hypothetical protein
MASSSFRHYHCATGPTGLLLGKSSPGPMPWLTLALRPSAAVVEEALREAIPQDAPALGAPDHDVRRDLAVLHPRPAAGHAGGVQRVRVAGEGQQGDRPARRVGGGEGPRVHLRGQGPEERLEDQEGRGRARRERRGLQGPARQQGHRHVREGRLGALLVGGHRHAAADGLPARHVLPVHAAAAGRRRQGDELRQVAREAAERVAEQGHLRRRRGHRRGEGRARRDHRLPQGPEEVQKLGGRIPRACS